MIKITLLAFAAVGGLATVYVRGQQSAHAVRTSQKSTHAADTPPSTTNFSRRGPSPKEAALMDRVALLLKEAAQATQEGNPKVAERLYLEVCSIDKSPFQRIHLAQLYDEQGRDREAYVNYRAVLRATDGWSSMQEDPRVLARYGDLSARLGFTDEARQAYQAAAAQARHSVGPDEPLAEPRTSSQNSLKAAAHLAAALRFGSHGEVDSELRELNVSAEADPSNWAARYYRAREFARLGRLSEAKQEALKAKRLAPARNQASVQGMMRFQGLDKSSNP